MIEKYLFYLFSYCCYLFSHQIIIVINYIQKMNKESVNMYVFIQLQYIMNDTIIIHI